jgi:ribose transport system ATP-binding protein
MSGVTEAAADTPILRMRDVAKTFGSTHALRGVSFDVLPGEVHALVGENGAGKSTLMKILSGVHRADRGTMELFGAPYRPSGPLDARRSGVAMIYQELNLAPHLSVEENIMLGREIHRFGIVDRRAHRFRAREALSLLGHGDLSPDARIRGLSVGAQQLVEVARALAFDARIIVFDEPTSALAAGDVQCLFAVIRRLREHGVGVVYISHFLEEVNEIADRFTVLRDGESVGSGLVRETAIDRIIELMVGRKVTDLYPRIPHEIGANVLSCSDLAGLALPHGATFTLHAGEILGVAGLIGAGRTELVRALFGLDPVARGEVIVRGVQVCRGGPRRRIAAGLGMLSENRKEEGLAVGLSVADNVTLSRFGPCAPGGWLRRRRQRDVVSRWIERLSIRATSPWQPVGELSGGNQQKVAVARLLHQEADILLFDEPTRGIDVASKAHVYRLMGELARAGTAILFVSSYLPELLGVCDTIAVMARGKLSTVRPREAWTEASVMAYATGGGP